MAVSRHSKLGYNGLLVSDLDEVVHSNASSFAELSGRKILVLGGTGFVGKWLIASLMHSLNELSIDFEVTIVTRDAATSKQVTSPLNHNLNIVQHDLSTKPLEELGCFDLLVHGATPSVPSTGSFDDNKVQSASRNATQTILSCSRQGSRIINLSSGAVMGNLRNSNGLVEECSRFGTPTNVYAQTKMEIEEQFNEYVKSHGVYVSHARLFAFSGPFISLTDHFAVGNFMKNTIDHSAIVVNGNPETTRSYMYPTDLISSLIQLIPKLDISHVNIGNPKKMKMSEIAEEFSKLGGNLPIKFRGNDQPVGSYVPEIRLLTESFNFSKFIDLHTGIKRWKEWLMLSS